jgi:hypothetical protein
VVEMSFRLIVILSIGMLISACGGGAGDDASSTPENATFDNATFDNSKWK